MPERLTVGVAARLSRYLQVLTQAKKMGKDRISSQEIAEYTNINATQIRRDLSTFGRFGKRGVGYSVDSLLVGDPQDPPHPGAAQHRARRSRPARRGDRLLADLRRARDHDRRGLRQRPGQGRRRRSAASPSARSTSSTRSSATAASSSASSPSRRTSAQDAADAARRRGRQDRLQLLAGADRHAVGRAGAHVEPGRRAPLRPVLPPHLSPPPGGDRAHPPLARLPPRRHRLERLHAAARARVEPRGARRDRAQPGAATRGVRPRRRRDRAPGRRRVAARLRARPLRGLRRAAARPGLHPRERSSGGSRRTRPPCASYLPADLVFANHVLLGGPVGAASGAPYAVKAHGSELEYSMRGNAGAVGVGRRGARRRPRDVRRLRAHPHGARRGLRSRRPRPRGAARASTSTSGARRRGATPSRPSSTEAARDPPNPGNAEERLPDEGNAERLEAFLAADRPTVVYFGKLIPQKGVARAPRRRCAGSTRGRVVGFGPERAALEALAAAKGVEALFTGPLEHRHLRHLLALADACVVPSVFPEAFGMVAAEAAAAGCPPIVARHSGLAEVAAGLEADAARPRSRGSSARRPATSAALHERLATLLALGADDRETLRAGVRRAVEAPLELGGASRRSSPRSAQADRAARRGVPSLSPLHERAPGLRAAPRRGARALRRGRGLHRLDRGGVRAPRSGDARPRQPLRGRAGRGAGHACSSRTSSAS